jgi:hypothetical protein
VLIEDEEMLILIDWHSDIQARFPGKKVALQKR